MTRSRRPAQAAAPLVVSFVVLLYAVAAAAQAPAAPPATTAATTEPDVPDVSTPPEPPAELNLINLPTTTSLNRHQSYFRLTHRFARDLRRGDFSSLAEDFFSLDNGAVIGLEYRFGITSHLQAGVHRTTLSKTIQFTGRYDALAQGGASPVGLSITGSIEGLANFHQNYQPGFAVTVSRSVGSWLNLYTTPAFVAHTRAADTLAGHEGHDHSDIVGDVDDHDSHDGTTFIGVGARVRIRPTAFVAGEYSPRVAGHDPGRGTWGVAIEKQTAGHTLQLNFTNSFGTTLGEIAQGGSPHDVYLGFNLIRRF